VIYGSHEEVNNAQRIVTSEQTFVFFVPFCSRVRDAAAGGGVVASGTEHPDDGCI
jgi:hypothetical protein